MKFRICVPGPGVGKFLRQGKITILFQPTPVGTSPFKKKIILFEVLQRSGLKI